MYFRAQLEELDYLCPELQFYKITIQRINSLAIKLSLHFLLHKHLLYMNKCVES